MREDIVQKLVVAVAVSVHEDEVAYKMLESDFIKGFQQYYRRRCVRIMQAEDLKKKETPYILTALLHYCIGQFNRQFSDLFQTEDTIWALDISEYLDKDDQTALSESHKGYENLDYLTNPVVFGEIIVRFNLESKGDMLSALVKRDYVTDSITSYLHSKDKRNTHAAIGSNKVVPIITDFHEWFHVNSASSFCFTGTFMQWVMHCFIHYYYPSHEQDIWGVIGTADSTKREVEMNITDVKVLTPTRSDDLQVHHLLINIVDNNSLMFDHSGQTKDAHGICYDTYYACLLTLCSEQVDKINKTLEANNEGFRLVLIDERDRKKFRNGLDANKGIANKINNGRAIITYIFNCIRRGNWNIDNIAEVRDEAFQLGKQDQEGKNCVWKNVAAKAETSRYLDKPDSAVSNFLAFDKIFKGVLSVYALMKGLEERGIGLVDSYPTIARIIEDRDLAPSVQYLSSFKDIDLMEQLWSEAQTYTRGSSGDLLQKDDMVSEYAGSSQNDDAQIKENRRLAYTRGLLDSPRLKQAGRFQTTYDQLLSVADYLTCIPRSFLEYAIHVADNRKLPQNCAAPAMLHPSFVSACRYNSLYYNKFLVANEQIAPYYLYNVAQKESELNDLSWNIATAMVPNVIRYRLNPKTGDVQKTYALYVPMIDAFLMFDYEGDTTTATDDYLSCVGFLALQEEVNSSFYNGRRNVQLEMIYSTIPPAIFNPFIGQNYKDEEKRDISLNNSVRFDSYVGFSNLDASAITARYASVKLYSKYKTSCTRYTDWMADIAYLQNSLVDILYAMLSYGLAIARANLAIPETERQEGQELLKSLLCNKFSEKNLEWFFDAFEMSWEDQPKLSKIDLSWGSRSQHPVEFTNTDYSCYDIIKGEFPKETQKASFMSALVKALSPYTTRAQRFVQLINFVNTKLTFLRVIRDAYDLVIEHISTSVSTYCCELNTRFRVEETLNSSKDTVDNGGLLDTPLTLLDTISSGQLKNFVASARHHNWQSFSLLTEDLSNFFKDCRQEISDLTDYDITSSQSLRSLFQSEGKGLSAAPPYTDPLVLNALSNIKAVCRVDDAGFLMHRNTYFKAHTESNDYYIHFTGRILKVGPNGPEPMKFDFNEDKDRRAYLSIIQNASNNNEW